MDNQKSDSSNLSEGFNLRVGSLDLISQKATQVQQILPMIEQRIREEVEPRVQEAEKDLIAIIKIELGKLGINADLTKTHQYVSGIADRYRERLVGERMEALAKFMVNVSKAIPPA